MPALPTSRHKKCTGLSFWTVANGLWLVSLWLLENLVGERTSPTALLTYIPQQGWGILPAALALNSLRKRRWKLFALNSLATLFWVKALLGFNIPLRTSDRSPAVRILSYNISLGSFGIEAVASTLKKENPDIICLQESQRAQPGHSLTPGQELLDQFPGWHYARTGDVMTLSRFPLVSQKIWPQRGYRRLLETTWQTPHGELRTLNVHVSTSFEGQAHAMLNLPARLWDIATNAKAAAGTRLEQIPAICSAGEGNNELPVVIIGDFNTPSRGLFYRALNKKWDDAWTQYGWGAGNSYPANRPLLSIDHAFLGHGTRATKAYRPRSRASDHLPLVVDVTWP